MAPTLRSEAVRVTVPASSANLGPGFDAFGLAVSLYDDLVARVTTGGLAVEIEGEGADDLPRDERHLVVRAMRHGFAALGVEPEGLRLGCHNLIPHARGLGSSSAAIVGGLALARALVQDGDALMDDARLYALADELEGHPDNVAAAIFGGFTTAWVEDGTPDVVSLDVHADVVPVACIPPDGVSTERARGLLPAQVLHADAARNAGRAALLVTALTSRPDLLMQATEDRLHQDYRAAAFPESTRLVAELRASGVPAVISGAGPTVMALASPVSAAEVGPVAGEGFRVVPLEVDRQGVRTAPVG